MSIGADATRVPRCHAHRHRACSAIRSPPTSSCWVTRISWGSFPCRAQALLTRDRAQRRRGGREPARVRLGAARVSRSGERRARRRVPPRPMSAATACIALDLDAAIARRVEFLTAYQDAALAQRYRALVDRVRAARDRGSPARTALTDAVARNYFKLLAIKDEYEVARLYTDGEFERQVAAAFEGDYTLRYHFAPPLWVQARQGHRRAGKAHLRRRGCVRCSSCSRSCKGVARHAARSVRPYGRAPAGTATHRRLRAHDRRARARTCAPTTSRWPWRSPALPATIRGYGHVKRRNIDAAQAPRGGVARAVPRSRRRSRSRSPPDGRRLPETHVQLQGIRVVDLSRILSGPFCSMFLADMGAEVIKIEGVDDGDPVRKQGILRNGYSLYFASFNRNKQSLTLDLRSAEGKAGAAQAHRDRRRRARQLPARRHGEDRPLPRRARSASSRTS